MNRSSYKYTPDEKFCLFKFVSLGRSRIHKAVIFQPMVVGNFYNLAMGDIDETGDIDVFSKSNNGDMEAVLATVIKIITHFFKHYPDAKVYVEGSTPARTRLYQIAAEQELKNFEEHFTIFGFSGDNFEVFQRNKNYSALAISLKIN